MRIYPIGDNALTVEFGSEMSPEINRKAISLADALAAKPFGGLIETLPAYASVSVFYEPSEVERASGTSFDAVRMLVERAVETLGDAANRAARKIPIPVSFEPEHAIDLEDAAASRALSTEEFLEIFLGRTYRVYMLGFTPGFAYMGEVDERIAVPRKETPRLNVPKGSVGIAGTQTGIYPVDSPGGWQVIGRTDLEMFLPENDPPTLLEAGDEVRFVRL